MPKERIISIVDVHAATPEAEKVKVCTEMGFREGLEWMYQEKYDKGIDWFRVWIGASVLVVILGAAALSYLYFMGRGSLW